MPSSREKSIPQQLKESCELANGRFNEDTEKAVCETSHGVMEYEKGGGSDFPQLRVRDSADVNGEPEVKGVMGTLDKNIGIGYSEGMIHAGQIFGSDKLYLHNDDDNGEGY